jgi:hypothetical protein
MKKLVGIGLPTVALAVVMALSGATPVFASGGGGGSAPPPAVAPIQLAPDASSLVAGQTTFVQVLVSPAAPAGGETLTVASSNASLSVPATVPLGAGLSNAQFQVTANRVTATTTATVTVSLATSHSSFAITVTPASAPAAGGVDIFPRVAAGGDLVTVTAVLSASAPPGGVTVAMASDSPALAVPATVFIPGGSGSVQFTAPAGTVTAATIVHVSESLGATTLTGQLEIDPARVLTGVALNATSVDGALGTTGGVSVSIPAVGSTFSVALSSSNPAVAAVPKAVGFLTGQTSVGFNVTTTRVTTPTTVTITASGGGVTKSVDLIVTPTPPPPFDIDTLTVAPATIARAGTVTATLTTTTGAPAGGLTIPVSSSDPRSASVPATVFLPAGATTVTFPVKVSAPSGSVAVGISALFHKQGQSALLNITQARGGTILVAGNQNQRLAPKAVGDPNGALGFYAGGTGHVESGQMPPGISLLNNIRPGEFFFSGTVQKAGTYTFVLEFDGAGPPYAVAYVWVIT